MIKESQSLPADPEDFFTDLKEEFLEEAIRAASLEFSYLECLLSLVRLKIIRFLKEKSPEMVCRASDFMFYDAIDSLQFTIKDFSGVLERIDLNHMKDSLLKDLNEFLTREGRKIVHAYSIDWKLESNNPNNLIVIIKTDIK